MNIAIYEIDPPLASRLALSLQQELDRRTTAGLLSLQEARLYQQNLSLAKSLEECIQADLILDCSPDEAELKAILFEKLDRLCQRSSILAATSPKTPLLSLTAAAKRHPERVLGIHFFPPIPEQALVQIVAGPLSDLQVSERAAYFIRQLGKEPITVKDSPGLLVDRLTVVYTTEALRIVGEGHVEAATVDKLMSSLGIPEGPFRVMDRLGLDSHAETIEGLYEASFHDARYRPHPILKRLIGAKHLGRKTKQGFYRYDD
jgi:3-hydroxybutyryl-CoA dehydrogenase